LAFAAVAVTASLAVRIRRAYPRVSRSEASHVQTNHGQVEPVLIVLSLGWIAGSARHFQLAQEYPAEVGQVDDVTE
jgi:hypothetical protein